MHLLAQALIKIVLISGRDEVVNGLTPSRSSLVNPFQQSGNKVLHTVSYICLVAIRSIKVVLTSLVVISLVIDVKRL